MQNSFKELKQWPTGHQHALAKTPSRILKNYRVVVKEQETPASEQFEENEHQEDTAQQKPEIKYTKENGIITSVEIICTCGERIELAFDYDEEETGKSNE